MSTIAMWLKRILVMAVVAALGLAVVPVSSVYALGQADPVTPPAPRQISNEKLEQVWAREQSAYAKLGTFLDHADERLAKAQELIDKAKANGKDVSAIQAALDAFADAIKQVHPIYESMKGILSSHQGFDASGKVTDQEKALQTVKDMGAKLKEIRQLLAGPGRALREAIRAFRQANKPASTPTP